LVLSEPGVHSQILALEIPAPLLGPRVHSSGGSIHDQLATGRKLRVLTIIDTFSRYSPAIEPRFTFRGADVVEILEEVGRQVGFPESDPGRPRY
jgi:hypothetical protein